jgi:hypothetical protein
VHSRRARHRSVIGPALLLVIVAIVAVGCSGIGQASLDPGAPCGGRDEERAPGFHADLEALVPETLDGAAPVQRDSGRYCSERSLGVLADAGHESLDFAGATWPGTDESGLAIVAYRAPGLTLDQLADAFARGADDARSVNQVHAQPTEVAGRPAVRIDAVMRRTPQTVVIWPAAAVETFVVVIGSGVDEASLAGAVAAAADR